MLYCSWTENAVLVEDNSLFCNLVHGTLFQTVRNAIFRILFSEERPAIQSVLIWATAMLRDVYCFVEERDAAHIYYSW
jgi:hypothetical protein